MLVAGGGRFRRKWERKKRKGGNRLTDFQKIGLKEKRGIGQVERLDLT